MQRGSVGEPPIGRRAAVALWLLRPDDVGASGGRDVEAAETLAKATFAGTHPDGGVTDPTAAVVLAV